FALRPPRTSWLIVGIYTGLLNVSRGRLDRREPISLQGPGRWSRARITGNASKHDGPARRLGRTAQHSDKPRPAHKNEHGQRQNPIADDPQINPSRLERPTKENNPRDGPLAQKRHAKHPQRLPS